MQVDISITLYTWGGGCRGKLGYGTEDTIQSPKLVEALAHIPVKVKQVAVACGAYHTGRFAIFFLDVLRREILPQDMSPLIVAKYFEMVMSQLDSNDASSLFQRRLLERITRDIKLEANNLGSGRPSPSDSYFMPAASGLGSRCRW